MDDPVTPEEPIARFLRQGSQMRRSVDRPHWKTFMPRVANGDISVYRTSALVNEQIRQIGQAYVARPGLPVVGHAMLIARNFTAHLLSVVPEPTPHPRHANVVGWESDPKNRVIAHELAEIASLVAY